MARAGAESPLGAVFDMTYKRFPLRPNGAAPDSPQFLGWLDRLVTELNLDTNPAVVVTATPHTMALTTTYLISDVGATLTVTLPDATKYPGKMLHFLNRQAFAINSASSNVVLITGGAAGTVIVPATAQVWRTAVSDGTNWVLVARN